MQSFGEYNLIPLSEVHKDLIYRWRNSDHIHENMNTNHLITEEEHALWFERAQNDDRTVAFLLVYQKQPIGFVNFTNIDSENKKCYWGFYIGELGAPKGSGQVMALLSLDHVFKALDLRKVCSEVLDFNSRSYAFHQKLGFSEEGRLKEQIYKNNRYVDVVLMALFKPTWLCKREKLLMEWR